MDKVSIVVATYNESTNIKNLLSSCFSQSYPNIEIVLVDSLKTSDSTTQIARKFTSQVFRYGQERSVQRNYGALKASGKYLLILDADMQIDSHVVVSCLEVIRKHPDTQAVIIPELSIGEGYWAKCKALERNCYLGDPSIEAPRFFSRSAFLKLGGYNPRMISGEDWDLHRRFKRIGDIGRISNLIFHNEGRLSLLKDIQKKFYYSRKSSAYIESNVTGVKGIFLFLFRPAFVRNWKKLLSDPIHLPGLIVMKSLEFSTGAIAIASQSAFWSKLFSFS